MKKLILFIVISATIIACKSKTETTTTTDSTEVSSDTLATATKPDIGDSGNWLCFLTTLNKDSTFVSITIEGDSVKGEMKWLPNEKDGAIGRLKGKKAGNVITADWNYIIEGSEQTEEKVFVLEGNKLLIKEGELMEKNGKLVMKNPEKAKVNETLTQTNCLNFTHE